MRIQPIFISLGKTLADSNNPDWEHDGVTDSARSELIRMGAEIVKVHKECYDDPEYDDDLQPPSVRPEGV